MHVVAGAACGNIRLRVGALHELLGLHVMALSAELLIARVVQLGGVRRAEGHGTLLVNIVAGIAGSGFRREVGGKGMPLYCLFVAP